MKIFRNENVQRPGSRGHLLAKLNTSERAYYSWLNWFFSLVATEGFCFSNTFLFSLSLLFSSCFFLPPPRSLCDFYFLYWYRVSLCIPVRPEMHRDLLTLRGSAVSGSPIVSKSEGLFTIEMLRCGTGSSPQSLSSLWLEMTKGMLMLSRCLILWLELSPLRLLLILQVPEPSLDLKEIFCIPSIQRSWSGLR